MFAWKQSIPKFFFFKINSLKIKNKQINALILLDELLVSIKGAKNFIFFLNFLRLFLLADTIVRFFSLFDK